MLGCEKFMAVRRRASKRQVSEVKEDLLVERKILEGRVKSRVTRQNALASPLYARIVVVLHKIGALAYAGARRFYIFILLSRHGATIHMSEQDPSEWSQEDGTNHQHQV